MSEDNLVSHADADAELAEYAREIRTLGKQAIVEIGKRLIKAKALCRPRPWLPWLDREFGWTDDDGAAITCTSRNAAAKSPNFGDLNVPAQALYLLAAPSTPAEVIEAIAERGEQGERLSLAEVKAIIAEVKARVRKPRSSTRSAAVIEYEVADEEPPQAARDLLLSGGRPKNSPCARSASRSQQRANASSFPITCRRSSLRRGRSRTFGGIAIGGAQRCSCVTWTALSAISTNMDAGAIIEALTDEERDLAHRVVDKLKAAQDEGEMDVEIPDQLK